MSAGPITRRALAVAAALLALTGMAKVPETRTLTGTVTYRERMALPPTAAVEVKLVDVSRADAPSVTIAEARIEGGPSVPVPFTLTYEADRIQDGRRYALEARITNGETLLFITATHYAVFTGGPDKTDLVLTRVGGAQASVPPVPPPSPEGDWRAVSIGGTPVAQGIESTLSITKAGEVSGKGGCNSFGGRASVDGVRLSFGAMRSTMMACAGPAMAQERAFLDALAATGRFGIADGQLVLMTETSAPLAVLERR